MLKIVKLHRWLCRAKNGVALSGWLKILEKIVSYNPHPHQSLYHSHQYYLRRRYRHHEAVGNSLWRKSAPDFTRLLLLLLTHQSGDCSLNHTLFVHEQDLGDDDDDDDDDDFDDVDDNYVANHQLVNIFQANSV